MGGKQTGRFSNGRIATYLLSEAFGIKAYVPPYLDPNHNISHFATRVSFASAATGYDNATSDVFVSNRCLVNFFYPYKLTRKKLLGGFLESL